MLLASAAAQSKDLADVIPGLYGGDGITLANPNHSAHFSGASLTAFDDLSSGISSGINLISIGSSTSSFTFDVQQAVFVPSTSSLGPTLAERADTIGEHKLNVAFTYTHAEYVRLDGNKLDNLNFRFGHEDLCSITGADPPCGPGDGTVPSPGSPGFELDNILVNTDIHLSQSQFTFFGKFGITPKWDVGLILPVVESRLRVNSLATIQRNSPGSAAFHSFCLAGQVGCAPKADISTLNSPDQTADSERESKTRIGDLLLRTKYNFVRDDPTLPDMAVLGGLRFDTGSRDNFSGAGNMGFQGYFIASKTFGMFAPHLNLGFELTTDGGDTEIWRVVAGSEFSPIHWLTLSADVLGQQSFNGKGVNDKLWDVGVGLKVNPFSKLAFIGDVLMPINKDTGLRTQFTWTAGVEYTF